jgi:hypothetical protein
MSYFPITDVCARGVRDKTTGICPEMAAYDGYEFYKKYLLNVSFIGNTICKKCQL